jgi:hypothetical protein
MWRISRGLEHVASGPELAHQTASASIRAMSTAELIYSKAKTLPDSAQATVLRLVERLAKEPSTKPPARVEPVSARGLVSMAEDFDAPLADFEPT